MKNSAKKLKNFIEFYKDCTDNCFWLYKYNYQGYKFWLRFRVLDKLMSDKNLHENSEEIKNATEVFAGAQFACVYGREGDKDFREFVTELESRKIATKRQLRVLVEGKELNNRDGNFEIKKPHCLIAMSGYFILPFYILAISAFSLMVILSPISLVPKIILFITFNLVFCMCAYTVYVYSIAPEKFVGKLSASVNNFIKSWYQAKPVKLTVIG